MKRLQIKAENVTDQGIFTGHASVFGVVDLDNDVVEPGAFAESIATGTAAAGVLIFGQHDDRKEPLGRSMELREDATGLFVKGQISDTAMGRDYRQLIKDGVLDQMSIGYVAQEYDVDTNNVRHLRKVDLLEISIVNYPANTEAKIESYKGGHTQMKTAKEQTPATKEVKEETGAEGQAVTMTEEQLAQLLEQAAGTGVNVYTHCEMLPAHGYPGLKKYPHLAGNFGTAWQNQQKEFADIPAPVLFTTNCLMPPRASYADRVFTTALVSYPEITHIGEDKDFTPVIEKALELGGYDEDKPFTGINGGGTVMTGFGHGAVLGVADQVIEAVKSGAIRHFFLVGGCDGARPGRNYYTEFVKQTPADTVVLTLACGKYRFNDLDLGTIGGLPRLMDVGQCNDAYGAVKIALALAEAFGCGVNDLPLSMVLSWYEQKAVCILLTLLYLGIKNIRLGPTLPAFVSPNVLNYLVENFGIAPITTPEEDLKQLLK